MHIFTDSSVNTKTKTGIGCYLILNSLDDEFTQENIQTIQLNDTSSTMAELDTIKHVLIEIDKYNLTDDIYLYTDCENFVNLIEKRQYNENLVKHTNYKEYKEIIDLVNKLKIKVIWVKGHDKQINKTEQYEKIFSVVDKTARFRLRMNNI
ncbi:ribonuclease H [Klosneuvirus KNV1]|uniref:Ribonuclease H n=1 Tax=Klosneuvirus KNV1 TaxID=1977640 RepID=A0A1V0SJC0_9VIRU|nr:ribonuclease H [Klosneuvirus KNV1]